MGRVEGLSLAAPTMVGTCLVREVVIPGGYLHVGASGIGGTWEGGVLCLVVATCIVYVSLPCSI